MRPRSLCAFLFNMVLPMASSCDMLPSDADQLHLHGALRPFCEKFGIWAPPSPSSSMQLFWHAACHLHNGLHGRDGERRSSRPAPARLAGAGTCEIPGQIGPGMPTQAPFALYAACCSSYSTFGPKHPPGSKCYFTSYYALGTFSMSSFSVDASCARFVDGLCALHVHVPCAPMYMVHHMHMMSCPVQRVLCFTAMTTGWCLGVSLGCPGSVCPGIWAPRACVCRHASQHTTHTPHDTSAMFALHTTALLDTYELLALSEEIISLPSTNHRGVSKSVMIGPVMIGPVIKNPIPNQSDRLAAIFYSFDLVSIGCRSS